MWKKLPKKVRCDIVNITAENKLVSGRVLTFEKTVNSVGNHTEQTSVIISLHLHIAKSKQ